MRQVTVKTHTVGKVFSQSDSPSACLTTCAFSPVSSKDVEATGHCGLSVSSTVENTSNSRLVFSCGVDCLFSLWLKYTVLKKFSLLLLLIF